MKRIIIIVITLIFIISADYTYAYKPRKLTESITWELSDNGTLRISGTGKIPDLPGNKYPWRKKHKKITSVIIENGITRIGNNCFSGSQNHKFFYRNITSISLPSSLREIGESAFEFLNITELDIPEGVLIIEEWAFVGSDLEKVKFPATLVEIGRGAFAFNNLSQIKIPGSVKSISESAFKGSGYQSEPTTIEIQEGVEEIKADAFYDIIIKKISLPTTLKKIGKSAFSCGSARNSRIDELIIPEGVHTIGEYAFRGCSYNNLSISSTVSSIGRGAFLNNNKTNNYVFNGNILSLPDWITEKDCKIIGISINSFEEYSPSIDNIFKLGKKYFDKKDYLAACSYFIKGTSARVSSQNTYGKGDCYEYAGKCYLELGKTDKAMVMFKNARTHGKKVNSYINDIIRIEAYNELKKGNYRVAFEKYTKLFKESNSITDLEIVPIYLEKLKDTKTALTYYKQIYDITNEKSIANKIAQSYYDNGDWDSAIEWYSIEAKKGSKAEQYKLAQTYEKAQNKNLAIFWYRKSAEQKYLKAEEALAHYGIYITSNQNAASKSTEGNSSSKTSSNNTYSPEYGLRDVWVQCAQCHGSGKCWSCNGNGWCVSTRYDGSYNSTYQCPICNGTGRCTTCFGTGGHYEKQQYQIR